jgi:hypothetical protein
MIERLGLGAFNSNTRAALLAFGFFLLFYAYNLYHTKLVRIFIVGILCIFSYALAVTFSRGALVALFSGLTCLFTLSNFRTRFRILTVIAMIMLIGICLEYEILRYYFVERFYKTFRPDHFHTIVLYNPRLYLWGDLLEQWINSSLNYMLFGRGFFQNPSDNTYINILINAGLVGLSSYLCFIFLLVKTLFHSDGPKVLRNSVVSALVVFIIFSFFVDIFANRKLLIPIFLFVGMHLGVCTKTQRDKNIFYHRGTI